MPLGACVALTRKTQQKGCHYLPVELLSVSEVSLPTGLWGPGMLST